MSEWVSVKDRLPEDGTRVLCYCRGNQYDICHFQKKRKAWFDRSWNSYAQDYVTHWMPLSELPKEDKP